MPVKFFTKEILYSAKPSSKKKSITKERGGAIPTAGTLTGIELRILPPFIKDNNTASGIFLPGLAKLYCVIVVVSDVNNQLTGGIDLQGFPRIGDKEHLPINKSIFFWQQTAGSTPPSQVHIMCSVVKSKKALREVGAVLSDLKNDDSYKGITQTLAGLAKNATAAGAVVSVVSELSAIVGKHLKGVEDKPLGTFIQSYTSLNGDFDTTGITKLDYPTKKVDFQISLIVRDSGRVAPAAAATRGAAKKTARKRMPKMEPAIIKLSLPFK